MATFVQPYLLPLVVKPVHLKSCSAYSQDAACDCKSKQVITASSTILSLGRCQERQIPFIK